MSKIEKTLLWKEPFSQAYTDRLEKYLSEFPSQEIALMLRRMVFQY